MLDAETITKREFQATLLRYKPLLKAVSNVKSASSREDDETLEDLDWFRFVTAPNKYMKSEGDEVDVPLEKDDVVRLVKWKLKHGKFRPNLLKLASSNPTATVTSTSLAAFAMCPAPYAPNGSNATQSTPNTSAVSAMRTLMLLTGIGPATSSLLLSVHAPDTVLFFSDEVFRWLCRGGKESPIKYNWKEYIELEENGREFMKRLDVGARDLERVAWVIMRGGTEPASRETAQDIQQERTEKSQRLSKEEKRPSPDPHKVHEKGSESPPNVPLKKARTIPDRMPSYTKDKSSYSPEQVPTISSGVGSLEKQAQEEAAIEGAKYAAQQAQLEASRAQIRAKSPPIPVQRGHLRRPRSPSLRASERTLMAISRQRIIPEDKIMKAFEANAKKPRPKSSRTEAEERKRLAANQIRAGGGSMDIPDAKTLARKASARLLEQQEQQGQGLERQKAEEGKEKKLEAVVEDLRSAGAKLGRVISPPPLRHRRGTSRKSADDNRLPQAISQKTDLEAEKASSKHVEAKCESPRDRTDSPGRLITPVLRKRDGSKFTEAFSPPLQQEEMISPAPTSKGKERAGTVATNRSSSEHKGRSPKPQTATDKRPRRVGTRAGLRSARAGPQDDAATIASVDCSGCLNLRRSPARR